MPKWHTFFDIDDVIIDWVPGKETFHFIAVSATSVYNFVLLLEKKTHKAFAVNAERCFDIFGHYQDIPHNKYEYNVDKYAKSKISFNQMH